MPACGFLVEGQNGPILKTATVEAEDLAQALELAAAVVRGWQAEARAKGGVLVLRGGVRVSPQSGTMHAVGARLDALERKA